MRRVCAWCKRELSFLEEDNNGEITHTICEDCAEMIRGEMKTMAETVETNLGDTRCKNDDARENLTP